MTVRCKCYVANSEGTEYGQRKVKLNLVYSQKPETENFKFHSASPSGNVTLELWSPNETDSAFLDQFKPGTFWYVDSERLTLPLEPDDKGPFLVLVGIKRDVSLPKGDDGVLRVQLSNSLRTELQGYVGGVRVTQEVYIANEGVYDQYTNIGDLYRMEFIPTTKEGS